MTYLQVKRLIINLKRSGSWEQFKNYRLIDIIGEKKC